MFKSLAKKKAFLNRIQKAKAIKKSNNKQHLSVILGTLSVFIHFNPHNRPLRRVPFIFPTYRLGNQGTAKLSHLP